MYLKLLSLPEIIPLSLQGTASPTSGNTKDNFSFKIKLHDNMTLLKLVWISIALGFIFCYFWKH